MSMTRIEARMLSCRRFRDEILQLEEEKRKKAGEKPAAKKKKKE